jgi:hypothetical protein
MPEPVSFDAVLLLLATKKPTGKHAFDPHFDHVKAQMLLQPQASMNDLQALLPLVGCNVEVTIKYRPEPVPDGDAEVARRLLRTEPRPR